jgi:hypothetical protein
MSCNRIKKAMVLFEGHTGYSFGHSYKGDINMMKEGCRSLETMVMHIFAHFGWKFHNRIEY